MKFISNLFKSIVAACPYSIIGKKCIGVLNNKPKPDNNSKNKTQAFKAGIKTGRNIALVGVFCPFLWYAILSGASKDFILLNVIHSGIIVVLGLVIITVNYVVFYANSKSSKKD